MQLSAIGKKAKQCFENIPKHFPNALVDEFIVMPNHIHGIIVIRESPAVETLHATSLPNNQMSAYPRNPGPSPPSFVPINPRSCDGVTKTDFDDFAWQPRFHDHIIRDDKGLERIRAYIRGNAFKWEEDSLYS